MPLALEAMQTEHEADRTTSLMMDAAEARACDRMGDMLARLGEVLRGLRLDPERMRANLDLGGGLIMAEAVMLDLGAAIGRQHAHDVVYDAAKAATVENQSFAELLAADPRVSAITDRAAIENCSTRPPIPASVPIWPATPPGARGQPPLRSAGRGLQDLSQMVTLNSPRHFLSGFRPGALLRKNSISFLRLLLRAQPK